MNSLLRSFDLKEGRAFWRRATALAFTFGIAALASPAAHADLFSGGTTTLFRITDAGVVSTFATGGGINGLRGLALGSDGFLYGANNGNGNILRFNPNDTSGAATATVFATTGAPNSLALDSANNVYVVNAASGTLSKFSSSGTSLFNVTVSGARGVTVGADGNVYVSTTTTNSVLRYDTAGTFLSTFATTNVAGPREIKFDAAGNLYVANNTGNTVTRYDSTGAQIGTTPFAVTGISVPQGLALDPSGNLYVANSTNGLIRKFDSTGASLGNANSTTLSPTGFGVAYAPAPVAVPEPGTFGLVALGFVTTGGGLLARRRRRAV